MPSPNPYSYSTGDGIPVIYEQGSFTPSSWGKSWGSSWNTAWGWHNLLIPYLKTEKPYEVSSG